MASNQTTKIVRTAAQALGGGAVTLGARFGLDIDDDAVILAILPVMTALWVGAVDLAEQYIHPNFGRLFVILATPDYDSVEIPAA